MGSTDILKSKENFTTNLQNKQDAPSLKQALLKIQNEYFTEAYQPVKKDNSLKQLKISSEIEIVEDRDCLSCSTILPTESLETKLFRECDISTSCKSNNARFVTVQKQNDAKSMASKADSETDSVGEAPSTNSNHSFKLNSQTSTRAFEDKDQSLIEGSIPLHTSKIVNEISVDSLNNVDHDETHFVCNMNKHSTDSSQSESETSTIVLENNLNDYQHYDKSSQGNENAYNCTDSTESTVIFVEAQESSDSSEDMTFESPLDQLPMLSSKELVHEWLNSASEKSPHNVFRKCTACAVFSAKKYVQPKFNNGSLKRDFASMSKLERIGELERIYGKKLPETSYGIKSKKRRPKWKF